MTHMNETPGTAYPPALVECTITAHPSDAHDYNRNAGSGSDDVPPGPIAEFVASVVEGLGERGVRAMRTIAEDDEYGPIHLVHLVCALDALSHFGCTFTRETLHDPVYAFTASGSR